MIRNKADYEELTVRILNSVIEEKDLDRNQFPEYTDSDFASVLEQCIKEEYLVGISLSRSINSNLHIDKIFTPYVTLKGLTFLESVKQSTLAESAHKISIAAIIKANKSFILSVIALLVSILINADKIVSNLQKILSYLGLQ